jgi:hypothetical protein
VRSEAMAGGRAAASAILLQADVQTIWRDCS